MVMFVTIFYIEKGYKCKLLFLSPAIKSAGSNINDSFGKFLMLPVINNDPLPFAVS